VRRHRLDDMEHLEHPLMGPAGVSE
jgi:hypothetical protein